MSKNCFRVVFSRVQGALVAVAETVSGRCASRGAAGVVSVTPRPLPLVWQLRVAAFGALCIFGLTPVWVAAQIVPNPNAGAQKPAVATTPSGIPLVQIARPSAAGVSNNQYDQFSVGAGAVLNNSPISVQSQLAGWIPGNANLGSPARIILNQVTGNLPSMLAGPNEVAGRRAEVVIANSAGVTCSGCGFINTSRGILTTGTPVIGPSGSLDAFRVTSGTVSFTGAGLNASNLDQVDVIARAVSVNASVFANSLNVITGTNQVDHATLAATPIAGTGAAPSVSVDVSQLGGWSGPSAALESMTRVPSPRSRVT
jgi:filamentous hemagglutinin